VADAALNGVSVLVAGAGLAGLAAAHDLASRGAAVTIVDARDRVGGRVWTIRDGFAENQHAEAGGDMIDEAQEEIRRLAEEVGLTLTRILRGGFGYVRPDGSGKPRIFNRGAMRGWDRLADALSAETTSYKRAERRWDSPITAAIARRSVARWLDDVKADEELRATATGLRGFFLADPDELSLVALVDQFSEADAPAPGAMYRIEGGNDALATALAKPLGARLHLNTEVAAVSQRGRVVRVAVKTRRTQSQITCDYAVLALPATLLRRVPITPALPAQQHDAIAALKYGRATKTLLQFATRFWRIPARPRAFGSPLPFGALWEGNEEQRGRAGILSLLAGGSASDATQTIVARQ
jgi:monoamine oxidase